MKRLLRKKPHLHYLGVSKKVNNYTSENKDNFVE